MDTKCESWNIAPKAPPAVLAIRTNDGDQQISPPAKPFKVAPVDLRSEKNDEHGEASGRGSGTRISAEPKKKSPGYRKYRNRPGGMWLVIINDKERPVQEANLNETSPPTGWLKDEVIHAYSLLLKNKFPSIQNGIFSSLMFDEYRRFRDRGLTSQNRNRRHASRQRYHRFTKIYQPVNDEQTY